MNDIEKLSDSKIVFVAEFTLKQLVDGAADDTKAASDLVLIGSNN